MTASVVKDPAGAPEQRVRNSSLNDPALSRWGLGEFWAGAGVALAVSIVTGIVATIAVLLYYIDDIDLTDPDAALALVSNPVLIVVGGASLWVGFGGACWWATRTKGLNSLAQDFGLRFRWIDLLIGLGVALALRAVEFGAAFVLDQAGSDVLSRADNAGFLTSASALGLVFIIPVVVLGAPFFEELFFRGLLLRSLLKRRSHRRGRTVFAVLVTALAFGVVHLGGLTDFSWDSALVLALVTGTAGLVLTVLAVVTKRLGPSIVTHFFYNSMAVVLALVPLGS